MVCSFRAAQPRSSHGCRTATRMNSCRLRQELAACTLQSVAVAFPPSDSVPSSLAVPHSHHVGCDRRGRYGNRGLQPACWGLHVDVVCRRSTASSASGSRRDCCFAAAHLAVRRDMIMKLTSATLQGGSPSTVNRSIGALRSRMTSAMRWDSHPLSHWVAPRSAA